MIMNGPDYALMADHRRASMLRTLEVSSPIRTCLCMSSYRKPSLAFQLHYVTTSKTPLLFKDSILLIKVFQEKNTLSFLAVCIDIMTGFDFRNLKL